MHINKINRLTIAIVMVLSLGACGSGGKTSFASDGGDTLALRYAENLTVVRYDSFTVATLRNPWDTTHILHTYVLVPRQAPVPARRPHGSVIRIPLERSMVFSSVHCGLLNELGVLSRLAGVCDLKYISLPEVEEGCRTGRIVNAGDGMNPDMEKIINLHPDAILLSPFENSGGYGQLDNLDVPLVECADYMETSALGRAEWMRFYGLLYGCQAHADSLFARIERDYMSLKRAAATVSHRPTVLAELKNGSAWYVPGGRSVSGRLYADAGADYVFASLKAGGSQPLSFEAVYDKAREADIWVFKYNTAADKTYSGLKRDFAPYAAFKAFAQRNVYACHTGKTLYYEEAPFHPDYLLADLIRIFHPGLLPDDSLRYFSKLAE